MVFGRAQLKNPTPAGLSNVVQACTVVFGIISAWVGTADFIPVHTSSIIQSILGLLIGLSNGLLPFFGVETNKSEVPIDQVTEMEEVKKTK